MNDMMMNGVFMLVFGAIYDFQRYYYKSRLFRVST
jgi:hypothetical protein